MNESIYYNIDGLHDAIARQKQVSFRYFEWVLDREQGRLCRQYRRGGRRYRVSPWALAWDDENYYLVAYDSDAQKIKHYRVDKMAEIQAEELSRRGLGHFRQFDMAQYSRRMFGMYGGEEVDVTLQFEDRLAGVIADRFGRETAMRPQGAGYFTITVPVAVSPPFFAWVFGLGTGAQISWARSQWWNDSASTWSRSGPNMGIRTTERKNSMDFYTLVQRRESCRQYEDRPVEPEKIDQMLACARLAPSRLQQPTLALYRGCRRESPADRPLYERTWAQRICRTSALLSCDPRDESPAGAGSGRPGGQPKIRPDGCGDRHRLLDFGRSGNGAGDLYFGPAFQKRRSARPWISRQSGKCA